MALQLRWLARYFGNPNYLPLQEEDLEALARSADVVAVAADEVLYREGEQAEAAFFIREGEVELRQGREDRPLIVGRVGPGAIIGDVEMFLEAEYYSTARCVEHLIAVRFQRGAILGEMAEHPRIALRWLVKALEQLDRCNRRVVGLLRKSVKGRLAAFLVEETAGEGEVRLTHAEISDLLGVSRQALSRAVGDLRNRGVIQTGRGRIRLVDSRGARRIAEERLEEE